MVEFMALVKGTFRKFQLQAEVVVLDHDATKRHRAFGVELYDLIEKQRLDTKAQIHKTLDETETAETKEEGTAADADADADAERTAKVETVESFLKVFQTIENEIKAPLEACRKDVEEMTSHNPPYPDLLIQRRKEDFGIEIWPVVSGPKWLHETLEEDLKKALASEEKYPEGGTTAKSPKKDLGGLVSAAVQSVVKGTKTTITKAIGKLSPEEREVEACVKVAKEEVASLEGKKLEKLTEIEELVSGGTTLECC